MKKNNAPNIRFQTVKEALVVLDNLTNLLKGWDVNLGFDLFSSIENFNLKSFEEFEDVTDSISSHLVFKVSDRGKIFLRLDKEQAKEARKRALMAELNQLNQK